MRPIPSGKEFRSNTILEVGLGATIAGSYFIAFYPIRLHALILYKPSMALCIAVMLIGQLVLQADNKYLEKIGGILIRISKIIGGVFLASAVYLALTSEG